MSFKNSMKTLSEVEGGYANDPHDRGRETYAGIARNFHSTWKGWGKIDEYKNIHKTKSTLNKALHKDSELNKLIESFYKEKFWDPIDNYSFHPEIKMFLFDYAVNSGHKNAYKALQRALGATADGAIGKKTLALYKKANLSFIIKLKSERDDFYKRIAKGTQKKYLKGWLIRSEKVLCYAIDCTFSRIKQTTPKPKKESFWTLITKLIKGK